MGVFWNNWGIYGKEWRVCSNGVYLDKNVLVEHRELRLTFRNNSRAYQQTVFLKINISSYSNTHHLE